MSTKIPIRIQRCGRCGEVQWVEQAEFTGGKREIKITCSYSASELIYELGKGEVPAFRLATVEMQPAAETEESYADHGEGNV